MKIELRTFVEHIYTDSQGKETPLRELDDKHLLNAYAKVIRKLEEKPLSTFEIRKNDEIESILYDEILRRMKVIPSTE